MRAKIAASLLLPVLAGWSVACDSPDPLEATSINNRAGVRIEGPSRVTADGRYTWIAITEVEQDRYEFEWEVFLAGSGEILLRASGPTLTLDVDTEQGELAIRLNAVLDGRLYTYEHYVTTCGVRPPFNEDLLVDECLVQR